MSDEVSKIKELWQNGEQLSTSGKHPDALLNFARAKALLLIESKKLLGSNESVHINNNSVTNSGTTNSKLMGDILTKLTTSINRDIKLINANPVHALGLVSDTVTTYTYPLCSTFIFLALLEYSMQCNIISVSLPMGQSFKELTLRIIWLLCLPSIPSLSPQTRGFSKADVKKAHRKAALKYHPDKNPDCDTAGIFSAIQSSYEKLSATLDEGPGPSAGGESRRSTSNKAYQDFDAQDGSRYSQFKTHKDLGRRGTSSSNYKAPPRNAKPSPYEFDQTRTASSRQQAGAARPVNTGGRPGATSASKVSGLTTEHLRVLLKQFGFAETGVDRMDRGELIKKYLAVSSHVEASTKKHGGVSTPRDGTNEENDNAFDDMFSFDAPDYADPAAFGAGAQAAFKRLAKEWSSEWARQMQEEFDRDTRRRQAHDMPAGPIPGYRKPQQRQQAGIPEGDAVPGYEFTHIPGQNNKRVNKGRPTPSPYASNMYTKQKAAMAEEERLLRAEAKREEELKKNIASTRAQLGATRRLKAEEEMKRAQLADALRSERATWMRDQLPHMSVAELRRIVQTSGLSLDGCVDRLELSTRLARHYGITLDDAALADIQAVNAKKGTAGNSGMSAAEAALNSRFAPSGPLDPINARPNSKGGSAINEHSKSKDKNPPNPPISEPDVIPSVSSKMDAGELRRVVQASGMPGSGSTAIGSGYITKEKLHALERRVLGGGRERGSAKEKPSNESAVPSSLDDVLASAALSAAEEATEDTLRRRGREADDVESEADASDSEAESDDELFMEQLRRRGWDVNAFPQNDSKKKSIAQQQEEARVAAAELQSTPVSAPGTARVDDEPAAEATSLTPGQDKLEDPRPSTGDAAYKLSQMAAPPVPQLGLFDHRDKEQILAFESLLEQAEKEAEETVNPVLPPGRIRARPKSGLSSARSIGSDEGAPVAKVGDIAAAIQKTSPNGAKGLNLHIDLSKVKAKQTKVNAQDPAVATTVQEEVDFWVHSAREDEEGRQTYREMEDELKRLVEQDKQDLLNGRYLRNSLQGTEQTAIKPMVIRPSSGRVRSTSPIVSPQKKQFDSRRSNSPYSSDGGDADTDTGTEVTDGGSESDPMELSANPRAGFLFFG
jgi:hypothetical protein